MSTWDKYYQCVLYDKRDAWLFGAIDPIRDAAKGYKKRYSIPDNRCSSCPDALPGHTQVTTHGYENVFGGLDRRSKLIIVAHGTKTNCGGLDPQGLANFLWYHGLHEVGLIAFKVCLVGKSTYLPQLKQWLGSLGVDVGWFVGYRYSTWTVLGTHEAAGLLDLVVRHVTLGNKLPDNHRVRVEKGNIDVNVAGSGRYTTP